MGPLKIDIRHCLNKLFAAITFLGVQVSYCQPIAQFSATPVTGCSPLVVQFNDQSTGNPASWQWDLGNGTQSSQRNPATTYILPGTYSVTLTVTNTSGSHTVTKTQFIKVFDRPTVSFTVSESSGCIPFTAGFTDQSTSSFGSINSWQWDFDDGSTSSERNPRHLYQLPGTYNITLTVTNEGGCSGSLSKLSYVRAFDSVRTLFSFSQPSRCKPPETIRFINNSTGPGTLSYRWDFGDGGSSTTPSPSYTYQAAGNYTVSLIATSSVGCRDTLTLPGSLQIRQVQPMIAGPDTVCAGKRINLQNATQPAPLSTIWKYDDGLSTFGNNTARSWNVPGVYRLSMISNYSTCSDTLRQNITVLGNPSVQFRASDSASCRPPLSVIFSEQSDNGNQWFWSFGDGYTSTEENPAHTYTEEGDYAVSLQVINAGGCTTTLHKNQFIKIRKPVVQFDKADGGGCIPYTFQPLPQVNAVDSVTGYLWDFGNGSTSTDPLPSTLYADSGTYTVKLFVTTSDGCIDSSVVPAAVRTGTPPRVDFDATPLTVCPGSPVQFTDYSFPADQWLWNFAGGTSTDQNPSYTYFEEGVYSVKLYAWNNGCKDSLIRPRYITVLPGLARFRPVYNCSNKLEVQFRDSSIRPESWSWNFGDGNTASTQNPVHRFNDFRTYTVSLTTTSGICTNTRQFAVTPLNVIPGFSIEKGTICKNEAVAFYASGFNKGQVRRMIWDFGDGTIDSLSREDTTYHTYTLPGLYTISLTLEDNYGCRETLTRDTLLHVKGPSAGFTLSSPDGCIKAPVVFTDRSVTADGVEDIVRWTWDFGDGNRLTITQPSTDTVMHAYQSTGNYYPSLIIADAAGCTDSLSSQTPVNIHQPSAGFLITNVNTCMADTLIIKNLSASGRLQYLWDFGDGTTSTDSIPLKQYTANGDYSIRLRVTDNWGCRDSLIRNNYIRVRTVTADFSQTDTIGICTPFKMKFTNQSVNATSQVWQFGDGGFSSTAHPQYYYMQPGNYTIRLTARRSANCFSTDSARIRIIAPAAVLQYTPVEGCAPLQISLRAISNDQVSFLWDMNDGTSTFNNNPVMQHTYTQPGVFLPTLLVKDSNGCIVPVTGRDSIRVFSSRVHFGIQPPVVCGNETVQFKDSTFSGGTIRDYRWRFGDGSISTAANPVHSYTQPGFYTVSLTVTTTRGCTDSVSYPDIVKVVQPPAVFIRNHTAAFCGEARIGFEAGLIQPDTSAIRWLWVFGNGDTSNQEVPPVQPYNQAGNYLVTVWVTNSSGCRDSASTSLVVHPLPPVDAGNDTAICRGTTAQLQATGAETFTWEPAATLSCTQCANPLAGPLISRHFVVSGVSMHGCRQSDTLFIEVKQPVKITGLPGSTAICAGNSTVLEATGAESYRWTPAAGINDPGGSSVIAAPATTTLYQLAGSDVLGCFADTVRVLITVHPNPSVDAGDEQQISTGQAVTVRPNYSADAVNWQWQPPQGLNCLNCAFPTASPEINTSYKVTAFNRFGCSSSDSILIRVSCDKNSLYLPNAFTPGNDGLNDYFYPRCFGKATITSFKIFNRNGEQVFQQANFQPNDRSKGWDGRIKGVHADPGNYAYTIEYICGNKETAGFTGNILLLR